MARDRLTLLPLPRQLSLDLDLGDADSLCGPSDGMKRSVIFPKNIYIFNVPEFQRQVAQLFEPLNISIEFRRTRHNRLEMCWSFPQEVVYYNQKGARQRAKISQEESAAFETLALSFASARH